MDDSPFHQLAIAQLDAVYRLAYQLAGSAHEADDLVQETYLRAIRSANGFELREHGIRPWLFKILHNVLNTRRSKDSRDAALLESFGNETGHPSSRDGDEIGGSMPPCDYDSIDWDQVDGRLKSALDALPLAYRTVFLLSALERLKYREIAEITGVPIGTVMSRLARARAALVEKLKSHDSPKNVSQQFDDRTQQSGRKVLPE